MAHFFAVKSFAATRVQRVNAAPLKRAAAAAAAAGRGGATGGGHASLDGLQSTSAKQDFGSDVRRQCLCSGRADAVMHAPHP